MRRRKERGGGEGWRRRRRGRKDFPLKGGGDGERRRRGREEERVRNRRKDLPRLGGSHFPNLCVTIETQFSRQNARLNAE